MLKTSNKFHQQTMQQLEDNAMLSYNMLKDIPGIKPVKPQGAMYLMLEIQLAHFRFKDELEFIENLVQEESVLCLPGQCFRCDKPFMRIVVSPPSDKLKEAFARLKSFCQRNAK
jgi:tyrosine aminotransferase